MYLGLSLVATTDNFTWNILLSCILCGRCYDTRRKHLTLTVCEADHRWHTGQWTVNTVNLSLSLSYPADRCSPCHAISLIFHLFLSSLTYMNKCDHSSASRKLHFIWFTFRVALHWTWQTHSLSLSLPPSPRACTFRCHLSQALTRERSRVLATFRWSKHWERWRCKWKALNPVREDKWCLIYFTSLGRFYCTSRDIKHLFSLSPLNDLL